MTKEELEKEAEEYLYDRLDPKAIDSVSEFSNKHIEEAIVSSFKDGAEFGYNKAKEEMQGQEFNLRYENGIYKYKDKSGKEFESTDGKTWKEIVLPKEIE